MGLRERATDEAQLRYGANGHDYVFARRREAVETVARAIGRRSGIYYRPDYRVWVIRIRAKRDKEAVRRLFGRLPGGDRQEAGFGSTGVD
jgi:hypothetical protein